MDEKFMKSHFLLLHLSNLTFPSHWSHLRVSLKLILFLFTPPRNRRLQLLQPRRYSSLLRAMYSLLMLLPQSNAWRTLNTRMQSIPIFAMMQVCVEGRDGWD